MNKGTNGKIISNAKMCNINFLNWICGQQCQTISNAIVQPISRRIVFECGKHKTEKPKIHYDCLLLSFWILKYQIVVDCNQISRLRQKAMHGKHARTYRPSAGPGTYGTARYLIERRKLNKKKTDQTDIIKL